MNKNSKDGASSKKILLLVIAFAVLLIAVFSGLHILESTVFHKEPANSESSSESESESETESEEMGSFPRQDVTTLLLIGVDKMDEIDTDEGSYRNNGAADVITLLIFDEKTEKINMIAFNRDSRVEMPFFDSNGVEVGTVEDFLTLSYSYGDGMEESCENVVNTIEMLLEDVSIDYYASIKMGGIAALNDVVGGVTVNVTDDFSAVDPDITMGEYTLKGDEALTFIRARQALEDDLNVSRMERQKEYAVGFMTSLKSKMSGDGLFAMKLLEATDGYLVTNCSGNTLMSLAERYKDYELGEIVSPPGENILGEEHYEFYINPMELAKIVGRFLLTEKLN